MQISIFPNVNSMGDQMRFLFMLPLPFAVSFQVNFDQNKQLNRENCSVVKAIISFKNQEKNQR